MTDNVRVNITLDNYQLAEIEFIPLGDGDWSARIAILLPEGLKMIQRGIPAYPDDLNSLGLVLSAVSQLPLEAFQGPIKPEPAYGTGWLRKHLGRN